MRFFWSYHPDYWEGLRRTGLLRGDIGVRFVHSPWASAADGFNVAAAEGTALHRLVCENGYGLLVDRAAGGCLYRHYDFDRGLLAAYERRLGERLLGVQLHEWMGWMGHLATAITHKGMASLHGSPHTGDLFPRAGLGTADDYAKRFPLSGVDAFVAEAERLYRVVSESAGHCVNLVDSGVQSYREGLRLGARHIMPELGQQTPMSRLQVAYARGMARAAGRPWGVYYECWGGTPFSVTCYNGESLWRTAGRNIPGAGEGTRHGGAGGSGRSLQRRLLLFAWLAGAENFAEEWGDSNTFHDWTRYGITPYGQVIADYLDLAGAVEPGPPETPVALVLDAADSPVEVALLARWIDKRFRLFPPGSRDEALRAWLAPLFWPADAPTVGHHSERGNDWFNLTNTGWPDVFDIVPSDAAPAAFDRYQAILHLGADETALRARLPGFHGEWISRTGGVEPTLARLRGWLRRTLPVWVEGTCQWTLNRRGNVFLLSVFNNEGVHRTVQGGETVCEALTRDVRIAFPSTAGEITELGVSAGSAGKALPVAPLIDNSLTATMKPGAVRLWSFRA